MLELNYDACWRYNIGAMNLPARRRVADLPALFGEFVLPLAVPGSFVFPPRVTVFWIRMRPMMDDARTAFRYGRRAAYWALSSASGKCLTSFRIYKRVLQSGTSHRLLSYRSTHYDLSMPVIDNRDEADRVRSYTQALQDEISGLKVYPRVFARYPFDHIGLALVSKAFSISNALLVLLESGFADEAFGLSRSLVECALTLRFLTQDQSKLNQRSLDYARFEVADKQYWMHYALQHATGEPMEQKIHDYAKQFDLKPDARGVQKHWSGKDGFAWKVNLDDHPLDNLTSTELVKKSTYAVEYHGTSSYVHCYSPALNNFLPSEQTPFAIRESSGEWHNSSQVTLIILISYLHSCVAYALFGMNLERTQKINDLFSDTLASLLPYRKMRS